MPGPVPVTTKSVVPTILVAGLNQAYRDWLVSSIQQQGYFVLEAEDDSEAIELVKMHSRPIHLLLAGEGSAGRSLAMTVKPYRPAMRVLFVSVNSKSHGADVLVPDAVVERIQGIVRTQLQSRISDRP
jgi:CheY-like chemotaxis protein